VTSPEALIGWVVDAQVDFMDPKGRLYVRDLGDGGVVGSVRIVARLRRAVGWMREKCAVVVFTGDWHALDDEEIDAVAPDPLAGTYPPHCMGRSDHPEERDGAAVIPEIRPVDPIVLSIDATDEDACEAAAGAVADRRPVFIQKNRFDVFVGNPSTEVFLSSLASALDAPLHFVVVGVARDVCVTQAVDGMQARSYSVTALSDVTWGLGLEPEETTLARWAKKGRVTTLQEFVTPSAPTQPGAE